jgi:hypothetical protein
MFRSEGKLTSGRSAQSQSTKSKSGPDAPRRQSDPLEDPVWASASYRSDLFLMVLIVLAGTTAVWLRWRDLGSQSLWLDEGYTLWISKFSPREIWQVLKMDPTSPLHYVLIHYWSILFGTSEFWLRALSAVFGTLSIPLYYLLARKILIERTAVAFAMAFYAVSFLQVWYAQEARCYALLAFLSLGSVYCLLLYLENGGLVRFCGVVLFLAASLYTHNMVLFYLPGIAVLWLVYPAERTFLARVKEGLLIGLVVLLLYLPWLPTLGAQAQRLHRSTWTLGTPGIKDLLESICIFSGFDIPTLQTLFRDQFHIHVARLFGLWTWAPAILVMVVVCIFAADRRKMAALAVYALSPVASTFALSRVSNPIYLNRVFLGCCSVLPMVFAAPIAFQVGSRRKAFELVGLVVLAASVVSAAGYLGAAQKEDWRGVAEYLVQLPKSERLIVVSPDIALPLVYYYAPGLSKSGTPTELRGPLTRFDPPDVDFEKRILQLSDANTDVAAALYHEMASGKYKEIVVAMRVPCDEKRLGCPFERAFDVMPMLEYLDAHCASTEVVEFQRSRASQIFYSLEVRRCSVPSTSGN